MPILHLHLLQRCNLSCAHCYSDSGPNAREALTLPEALGAVALGKRLGYAHVAISGGEPLLSKQLDAVIDRAKELGLRVSVVTNGIQASQAGQAKRLAGADDVCVSLDGSRATHDAMRRRAGAYDSALRAIATIREAGLQCGVSCGVSWRSLYELEEVISAVTEAGATLLNFHAVEPAGRAMTLPAESILDQSGQAVLYVAVHLLSQSASTACAIRCDLVHKDCVTTYPKLLYACPENPDYSGSVASRLGVLVVEPSGRLVPVSYGFCAALSLGSLRQAMETGGRSVEDALPSVTLALRLAGIKLLRELRNDDDWVVLNPSAELARVTSSLTRTAYLGASQVPTSNQSRARVAHRDDLDQPRLSEEYWNA